MTNQSQGQADRSGKKISKSGSHSGEGPVSDRVGTQRRHPPPLLILMAMQQRERCDGPVDNLALDRIGLCR